MSEIRCRYQSQDSGVEYAYVVDVRPGGKEIWSAKLFRNKRLVCTLARGLVESQLGANDLTEQIRRLVENHIDSLGSAFDEAH